MPWPAKPNQSNVDPDVVYTDGGSGLLVACQDRFAQSGCIIECDIRHTVWVKLPDCSRSVGLAPWQLNRSALEDVLADVEARLGLGVEAR